MARISNRDIQIEVITSLCKTNPDNGEVEEINQSQRLQEFLEKNTHILHPKLLVWNLTRGGKQVFHDRYLIRYHKNGKIDGFLLSNSLNSMGQFYPFVIAPMDYDVCLEVMEYLNEIRDSDVQKKKIKKRVSYLRYYMIVRSYIILNKKKYQKNFHIWIGLLNGSIWKISLEFLKMVFQKLFLLL